MNQWTELALSCYRVNGRCHACSQVPDDFKPKCKVWKVAAKLTHDIGPPVYVYAKKQLWLMGRKEVMHGITNSTRVCYDSVRQLNLFDSAEGGTEWS